MQNKVITGGVIGAIIGIPGSYFFQNEMVRNKFGGVGGYLSKLPECFDKMAWELGVPQNLFLGIAVFAVVGIVIGVIVAKVTEK